MKKSCTTYVAFHEVGEIGCPDVEHVGPTEDCNTLFIGLKQQKMLEACTTLAMLMY